MHLGAAAPGTFEHAGCTTARGVLGSQVLLSLPRVWVSRELCAGPSAGGSSVGGAATGGWVTSGSYILWSQIHLTLLGAAGAKQVEVFLVAQYIASGFWHKLVCFENSSQCALPQLGISKFCILSRVGKTWPLLGEWQGLCTLDRSLYIRKLALCHMSILFTIHYFFCVEILHFNMVKIINHLPYVFWVLT